MTGWVKPSRWAWSQSLPGAGAGLLPGPPRSSVDGISHHMPPDRLQMDPDLVVRPVSRVTSKRLRAGRVHDARRE